ncbi:MAG: histidine phosphatase family protein [Elusimicrobiota bacterium]
MKILFLMRHGQSPSAAESAVASDALRPISQRGRQDVRLMALEIAKRGGRPRILLYSPLTRALQTGAVAAETLKPAMGTFVFPPLDNTRPPAEVLNELKARASAVDEVLAVGHQPQVGEIAALLTGSIYDIRPGGVVAMELGKSPRLLWTLNPEELR